MQTYAKCLARAAGAALLAGQATASPLAPSSYDMLNGETGSYQYWDETYTGAGNVTSSLAPLTGGLGDLTDGVIATDNWFIVEQPPGNGPYVGWNSIDPVISFLFAQAVTVDSVTLYFDDANGIGGVRPPASAAFGLSGGLGAAESIPDAASGDPNSYTIDVGGLTGSAFDLQVFSRQTPGNSWLFLSEITFDGVLGQGGGPAVVPIPATLPLLAAALGVFGLIRRRA